MDALSKVLPTKQTKIKTKKNLTCLITTMFDNVSDIKKNSLQNRMEKPKQ